MNYEYTFRTCRGGELMKSIQLMLNDRWEPLSHSFNSNDYDYTVMFRRLLLSEDISA